MSENAYLVTTVCRPAARKGRAAQAEAIRTQIWNPAAPLALGHPLRWVAEQTADQGVRIRSLMGASGRLVQAKELLLEIPFDRLKAGAEVELPQADGLVVRIRPANERRPAYDGNRGRRRNDHLSVFECHGGWVISSTQVTGQAHIQFGRRAVFNIQEYSGKCRLEFLAEGLALTLNTGVRREVKKGDAVDLQISEIWGAAITQGARSWRIASQEAVDLPHARRPDAAARAEAALFRRSLAATSMVLAAFLALAWLWPQPKPDMQELIPPQFAKLILTKPRAEAPSSASEGNPNPATAVPEKVAKAAVVQAFRAKALSSAVSGLLKGGMTSLLAQSDFVAGMSASAQARKIFDAKSSSLSAQAPDAKLAANTDRAVTALGGSAQGKGAGYGQGEHAGVKGQGQAFVSMDVGGAAVDEGLTKDEVGEVIHRHLSEVRYCYESAMIRTPDLEGKLMVGFTIGGNGVVKSTEVKSSTLPDPRLDDCILRRLATWKFPLPRGGIDVAVGYPFIFKTLGR